MPLRTDLIEQVFHELWTAGGTIIAEIERVAARIYEIIEQGDRPQGTKSRKARRAARKTRRAKR